MTKSDTSKMDAAKMIEVKIGRARMSDGTFIAWQMDGAEDAPVLLLSNSLGTSRAMWDAQIADLAYRFCVLRYDTRGHGLSGAPFGAYGLDRLGRDAIELLDALEIERAHFCGVSLGGMTGQWLGVHAAHRINHLVLANTAAYMGPPGNWQNRIDTVLAQPGVGMAGIVDSVLERWFTPEFLNGQKDMVGKLRAQLLACVPHGYAGCCAAIRDMDLRPVISLVSCPTLVISGLRDNATPPGEGATIASSIDGAQSISLDAAHLSNIEQAEAFTDALLSFLD